VDESGWDIRALEELEHEVFRVANLRLRDKVSLGIVAVGTERRDQEFYIELGDQFVRGRTVVSKGKSVRDKD
jgi:hypothetical protein